MPLNPSRFMFFGLHSCLPDIRETRVFGAKLEASIMHSQAMQSGNFLIGFVHLRFDPNAHRLERPLPKAVLI